jgi:hypothetical protein
MTAPDPPTQKIPPATTVGAQGGGNNRFGLSVTQIVASTAAAVTAALIGSRLGVAGTLTGAAVASVVSGVGAAVYGRSLLVTRRHMSKALRLVRPADTTPAGAATTTDVPGRWPSPRGTPRPDDDPTVVIARAAQPVAVAPSRSRRPLTVVLAGAAAAAVIFAGSMATVTLVEKVKGGPLSGGNSGLTIIGGNTSPDPETTTDPTTVTVTPSLSSSVGTTPTQTQTQTATVTQTPTPSPTVGSSTSVSPSSSRSSAGSAPPSTPPVTAAGGLSPATAPTAP